PEAEAAASDEAFEAEVAALASETDEPEGDEPEPEGGEEEPAASKAVVATAKAPLKRPARAKSAAPRVEAVPPISLTASAGSGLGVEVGQEINRLELAAMSIKARERFGHIPPGTKGEKIALAQFNTRDASPEERKLHKDASDQDKIDAILDERAIQQAFEERRAAADEGALVASGGLCAPVTPYYNLQMVA